MSSEGFLFTAVYGTIAAFPPQGNAAIPYPYTYPAVVGYSNVQALNEKGEYAQASFGGGPVFVKVGSDGKSYQLKDFTIEGGAPIDDMIQYLDDTANPYVYATYVSPDVDEDLAGWWDPDLVGEDEGFLNEETFDVGQAFLAVITSGGELKFKCAGEVERGKKQVVIPEGRTSFYICNPLPVNLTLGQITIEGGAPIDDIFQFLDDTANPYIYATFVPADVDEDLAGWWDPELVGEDGGNLDNQPLKAGQGMLGVITSGGQLTFEFPEILK